MLEQAAIAGALNPDVLADPTQASSMATMIALRLDSLAPEQDRGWQGAVEEDGSLSFTRTLRGVRESHVLDKRITASAEARGLDSLASELRSVYEQAARLASKDSEVEVPGPRALLDRVFAGARKGISVSRYKGLGEMNPEQLWETTLDPEVRSLLRVRVEHADEASDVFETLMGDVVEPRRNFIQENALKVANLDV